MTFFFFLSKIQMNGKQIQEENHKRHDCLRYLLSPQIVQFYSRSFQGLESVIDEGKTLLTGTFCLYLPSKTWNLFKVLHMSLHLPYMRLPLLTTSFLNHFLFSVAHISHSSDLVFQSMAYIFMFASCLPSQFHSQCFYSVEPRLLWTRIALPPPYSPAPPLDTLFLVVLHN